MSRFYELFQRKPIIGMLHLGGNFPEFQAMDDLHAYEEESLDGVIVENYHGSIENVENILCSLSTIIPSTKIGVNILGDFESAFGLAARWNAGFIQIDSIQPPDIDEERYHQCREKYSNLVVLGGVGFKYTTNPKGNLESWLEIGKSRCDAIVTTGPATGKETPIEKLRQYRKLLGDFPLIEGAGSNPKNVYEHLRITDGVIVGSYFKPRGNTQLSVEIELIKAYMIEANKARGS